MAARKPPKLTRKVTADNLARLGSERLAAILESVADGRPDVKRRLRMELAAELGAGPLSDEIDKRLVAYETSKGRIGWRQKPGLIRELETLREVIVDRLVPLDRAAAADRLWRYMGAARAVRGRLREAADLDPVYIAAARELGALAHGNAAPFAARLAEALAGFPAWTAWLPDLLEAAQDEVAGLTLADPRLSGPGVIRILAEAAGDAARYEQTFSAAALATPGVAAQVARMHLAAGDAARAARVLRAAGPKTSLLGRKGAPDFDWETVSIEVLEATGETAAAQDARWASFERTLSADRARAFISRLADFDDVEAEEKAFAIAARHPDFEAGLRFLVEWPNYREAARMIEARADEAGVGPDEAELWAGKLRARHPRSAEVLLRRSAALAFRRRDLAAAERLTQEADSIEG